MIDHWKVSFKTLIDEAEWMDLATKIKAKEKVDAMRHLVAYPDWILDSTLLENYYSNVGI